MNVSADWFRRLRPALIVSHIFSIGLKSGEYGGRKKRLHPFVARILIISGSLWNEALSGIRTCPGFISGRRISLTHVRKRIVSVYPLKTKGAMSFPQHCAAMTEILSVRLPVTCAYSLSPCGAYPYFRSPSCSSSPHSSV